MYMDVLVSIIIPIYNSEEYLARCLQSVVDQTYANLEIYIVDSGAIDSSRDIAEGFAARDKRIKCLDAKGSGPANARMTGYEVSSGKYITFVDSDDYLETDYIKKLVETAEHNNSELVVCGYISENSSGETLRVMIPDKYERGKNEIWPYRICSSWGRLYLRELWIRYGVKFIHEEGAIGEDMAVSFLTNAMAKNITVVPYAGYHYVRHASSIMASAQNSNCLFPYEGIRLTHKKLAGLRLENSRDFYFFGLLKFFSKYQLEMTGNLIQDNKREFQRFISEFTKKDSKKYADAWKKLKNQVSLPGKVKLGMWIMLKEIQFWDWIG